LYSASRTNGKYLGPKIVASFLHEFVAKMFYFFSFFGWPGKREMANFDGMEENAIRNIKWNG
jgi:hypothetical protein